jgi:hypothetical protein
VVDTVVPRQDSKRTENSAILYRDGCSIQVVPSLSSAKILPGGAPVRYTCIYSGIPVYIKDGGTWTFSRRYVGSDENLALR